MPQTQEERQFYAAASKAIYQVMPQEKERFSLALADRANPSFPGEGRNNFEQVPCERIAAFTFIGYANELGGISVALCRNGARVRQLAAKSRVNIAAMLKELAVDGANARKAGWNYELETLGNGAEFHYFPVIAIGHGILTAYTGVLYERKTGRAVVVQAAPYPMCEHFREYFGTSPFCADMRQSLKRVVLALQKAD